MLDVSGNIGLCSISRKFLLGFHMEHQLKELITSWAGKTPVSFNQIGPNTFAVILASDAPGFLQSFPAFARSNGSALGINWVARVAHLQCPRVRIATSSALVDLIAAAASSDDEARVSLAINTFKACSAIGGIFFAETLEFIVTWTIRRRLSSREEGFPDISALSVLAAWSSAGANSLFDAIRKFYTLADWPWYEGSIARQVDAGEFEEPEPVPNTPDRDDHAPLAKKNRLLQGHIRELARIAECGVYSKPLALTDDEGWDAEKSALEALDVMPILSPLSPSVNLAVRVLESHKKAFIQELARGRMLVSECTGDGVWYSQLLQPLVLHEYPAYIVYQVEAENIATAEVVMAVVGCERWFAMQELQAFEGVYLRPITSRAVELPPLRLEKPGWVSQSACDAMTRVMKNGVTLTAICGVAFPREYPYSATTDLKLDLNPPIVSSLLRSRVALREFKDEGKFFLSGGILRGLPASYQSVLTLV